MTSSSNKLFMQQGLKTKRAVMEAGLRVLLHLKGQEEILRLVGKVRWEGNLEESRQGRDSHDSRRQLRLDQSAQ